MRVPAVTAGTLVFARVRDARVAAGAVPCRAGAGAVAGSGALVRKSAPARPDWRPISVQLRPRSWMRPPRHDQSRRKGGSAATIGASAGSQSTLSNSSAASHRNSRCSSRCGRSALVSRAAYTRSTACPCPSCTSVPTRSPTSTLTFSSSMHSRSSASVSDSPSSTLPPGNSQRPANSGGSDRAHPSVFDDGRADDDQGHWPFGLHEPSDCQIFTRSGTLGVPISAVASDLWP
jgi:hypothetical protein